MKVNLEPSQIFEEWKRNEEYKTSMGFYKKWNEQINFIEGNQWPPATPKTKNFPRPVINQCDFIIENKQSNILSQTIKMLYSPEEIPEGEDVDQLSQIAEDFTDAATNTWNDIDQDTINEDVVNDVLSIGTGIWHYYWDNEQSGGQFTKYIGKIQCDTIDAMDIAFGNPKLKPSETQKQPYIIIRSQKDTEKLKEIAKEHGKNYELIVPDEKGTSNTKYDNDKKDLEGAEQTTLLTKYYKQDGQIYWTKVTETAIVQKPVKLSPTETPFCRYPVEVLVFKRRRKCVYGRSIIEDIIPNQKSLNWGLGMMLLSVQQTAWPKIIAKMGALVQSVTNEPGEILIDHSGMQGIDGIKYMQPPNFSSMPMMLSDKILEMTRQVTGVTEVNSGEILGANMAAAAIMALQNQAKKPNESYQKKLYRSQKNIGRIEELFFKCYYNLPRPIKGKDAQGKDITKIFEGAKYADMQFGLKIDVGPASEYNESLQMTVVQAMYDKKDLTKYQFVKYAPKNIVPQELSHDFEKEEEQILEQQKLQAEQQAQAQAQPNPQDILSQLSPEELQHLQENPALQQQLGLGGGQVA
jgi:hypothetical protein